jgi:hypothetical protein
MILPQPCIAEREVRDGDSHSPFESRSIGGFALCVNDRQLPGCCGLFSKTSASKGRSELGSGISWAMRNKKNIIRSEALGAAIHSRIKGLPFAVWRASER